MGGTHGCVLIQKGLICLALFLVIEDWKLRLMHWKGNLKETTFVLLS